MSKTNVELLHETLMRAVLAHRESHPPFTPLEALEASSWLETEMQLSAHIFGASVEEQMAAMKRGDERGAHTVQDGAQVVVAAGRLGRKT